MKKENELLNAKTVLYLWHPSFSCVHGAIQKYKAAWEKVSALRIL